jgi:3-hydroxybutyryl-CoA dehydratase
MLPREREYQQFSIGDKESFKLTLSEEMIDGFGNLSGDLNPLHMDQDYAAQTPFGRRVAHGLLLTSFFSRLVGMHLPGKYALYISQSSQFHRPAFIGSEIIVEGEIIQKVDVDKVIKLATSIRDSRNKELLVTGEALVKLLK